MLPYRGRTPSDEAATAEEIRRFPTVLRRAALREGLATMLRGSAVCLAILLALVVVFTLVTEVPGLAWK